MFLGEALDEPWFTSALILIPSRELFRQMLSDLVCIPLTPVKSPHTGSMPNDIGSHTDAASHTDHKLTCQPQN